MDKIFTKADRLAWNPPSRSQRENQIDYTAAGHRWFELAKDNWLCWSTAVDSGLVFPGHAFVCAQSVVALAQKPLVLQIHSHGNHQFQFKSRLSMRLSSQRNVQDPTVHWDQTKEAVAAAPMQDHVISKNDGYSRFQLFYWMLAFPFRRVPYVVRCSNPWGMNISSFYYAKWFTVNRLTPLP